MYQARRRWYRTADDKLVGEGDPRAAFLLVAAGGELSQAEADKYHLPKIEAELDAPAAKAVAPVEDKAVKPAADKATKARSPNPSGARRGGKRGR